jgi:hypothetical protein
MRFLSIEMAVCEIGVEPAVGLAELCDPTSKVESAALLLVCDATVIVVFPFLRLPVPSRVMFESEQGFNRQRSAEV